MGTNIRNFNSWKRINEGDGFAEFFTGLNAALTGKEAEPVKPAEKVDASKKSEASVDAKADSSSKTKSQDTDDSTKDQSTTTINTKPYAEKLQNISKKLGPSSEKTTVSPDSPLFINLDLSKSDNVKLYGNICQSWLGIRKPMVAQIPNPITGRDFAEAAATTYQKTGVYVPPQLVLAQATLEGGFAKEKNKPIDTKNLFNVGNTDNGATRSFDDRGKPLPGGDPKASWKGGILAYFDILADRYLIPGKKTADDLVLGEFVNTDGNRYASGKSYEEGLLKLIDEINTKVIA